ncbi:MAG: class I SAM-dependent methyltransferase [Kofleriaceae bacterium]|nr:class I SAM-dependent methyltransferase [Kofleriaceae bacterium]
MTSKPGAPTQEYEVALKESIATWNERAAGWDSQKEAQTYAEQAFSTLEPLLIAELPVGVRPRVLDFGAGTGLLTAKLLPLAKEVVAIDIADQMLKVLGERIEQEGWTKIKPVCGDLLDQAIRSQPIFQAPFDLIVASSVCSFLPDYPAFLDVVSKLLSPQGIFVQWDWLANEAGDWASGFSLEQIENAYSANGLQSVRVGKGFVFEFQGKELDVLMGVARKLLADC